MFGNFDAAVKLMQLSSLIVVLIVVAAAAELELQQSVETGGGRKSIESSFRSEITTQYPYLVGLTIGGTFDHTNQRTAICTGTLLSPVLVLSSAYCTSRLIATIKESPEETTLLVYWKTTTNSVKYHRATNVYTHPSYNSATRKFDISLIKLKKPFKQVGRFVSLSSKTLKSDVELSCVVVGIGAPHELGYKVQVRVKYGPTACRIPKSNSNLIYVIGHTWEDFLCVETVGSTAKRLPCDQADPLVCSGGRHQYGIFSYGYDGTGASRAIEATECGDPAIQGRHLFVNRNVAWITEMMAHHVGDSKQIDIDEKTTATSRRPTRPQPTTTTIREEVPKVTCTDHLERNYPYLVYLEGMPDEPVCGGTLVSPRHVLTTAYCTTRMTEIMVTVTTYHRQRTIASLVYIHPDFNSYTLTADISIVVLLEPLNVTRYAKLPDIVSRPTDGDYNKTAKELACAVVAASKRLTPYHYVQVNVKYGPKACRESLDLEIQTTVNNTWREFICGTINQQFRDDMGDPLICDGFQYGIVSHTYPTVEQASETGSADQVRFLVIKNHRGWIDQVITADNQLGTGDDRANASPGFEFILVLMTVVFQLLSQFG